jgi:hypothetical protein
VLIYFRGDAETRKKAEVASAAAYVIHSAAASPSATLNKYLLGAIHLQRQPRYLLGIFLNEPCTIPLELRGNEVRISK